MDYTQYVQEKVSDPSAKDRILAEIGYHQSKSPRNWEWDFINNFYGWIEPDAPRRNYRRWMADVSITAETTFAQFSYNEKASEKLRQQTPEQFFRNIDDTVKRMGFSVEELVKPIKETSAESLIKIMIELMAQGYYYYPDLSR